MEKRATVISVNMQKGGVGKTTTVHELASALTAKGHKVLCIDLDQQANLSRISGSELLGYYSIYEVLRGECPIEDSIQETTNYDISISHKKLVDADKEFMARGDVFKLVDAIEPIRSAYDYIILDGPPSLGTLPCMMMIAADYSLIVCESSSSGLQGLGQLYSQIESIRDPRRGENKNLKIAGLLLTMYNDRTVFTRAIREALEDHAEKMHTSIFDTTIHQSIVVKEAQSLNQSLIQYAPASKPAQDYMKFTEELIANIEGR